MKKYLLNFGMIISLAGICYMLFLVAENTEKKYIIRRILKVNSLMENDTTIKMFSVKSLVELKKIVRAF
jgi:hypothetical protein